MEGGARSPILDWIVDNVTDGTFAGWRFDADAYEQAVMSSGLEKRQQAVLLSGDAAKIQAVIQYELGADPDTLAMHLTIPIFVTTVPMHFVDGDTTQAQSE